MGSNMGRQCISRVIKLRDLEVPVLELNSQGEKSARTKVSDKT